MLSVLFILIKLKYWLFLTKLKKILYIFLSIVKKVKVIMYIIKIIQINLTEFYLIIIIKKFN